MGGGGCRSYAHFQDDTAAMSAYQLFAVIDRMSAGPAIAHAEHHVEKRAPLVARMVHDPGLQPLSPPSGCTAA